MVGNEHGMSMAQIKREISSGEPEWYKVSKRTEKRTEILSAVMWLFDSAKPAATGSVSGLLIKMYKDLVKDFRERFWRGSYSRGRGKVEEVRTNTWQRLANLAATPNTLCGCQSDPSNILELPKRA